MTDPRTIPSIDQLRQRPAVRALETRYGAAATTDALRAGAAAIREGMARPGAADAEAVATHIEALATARLGDLFRPSLQPVINATGVVVHTNLGRAPIGERALARVVEIARGYSTLEYDLARGGRGRRDAHAEPLLCHLSGAEAAVVVNNNAAATLLVLAALAAGREVIVSRGELVEIGGGFRVPDVMAQSGATLREVGTTNRTRVADYGAAISDRTALILRVHPSNFRIDGFTERPPLADLAALGRRFGVPVAEDLGSGQLTCDAGHPLAASEPTVRAGVEAGIDVCCFSGDKLLGGPQAGIIVGRAVLVDRIRRHPLIRALRPGKMTFAALEGTLVEYAAGRAAAVPVQRMLAMPAGEIRSRAESLVERLRAASGWRAEVAAGTSAVGGGSAPGIELATCLVAVERDGFTAERLEQRLRELTPPVIARIVSDRVVLDLRTVGAEYDARLPALLGQIGASGA